MPDLSGSTSDSDHSGTNRQAHRLGHLDAGLRFIDRIGAGARGPVQRARRVIEQDIIAVKCIDASGMTDEEIDGFVRQTERVYALDHPGLVSVLGVTYVPEAKHLYVLMRYMDMDSLAAVLTRTGALPFSIAATILRKLAEALAYAASRGASHGALHPGDVLVDMPAVIRTAIEGVVANDATAPVVALTGVGWPNPLPPFPGPQQYCPWRYASAIAWEMERRIDTDQRIRSDIFSLGAIFYHMLTGNPPLDAGTPDQIKAQHATLARLPLSADAVKHCPAGTERIIHRMLAAPGSTAACAPISTYSELLLELNKLYSNHAPKFDRIDAVSRRIPPRVQHDARQDSARLKLDQLAGTGTPKPTPKSIRASTPEPAIVHPGDPPSQNTRRPFRTDTDPVSTRATADRLLISAAAIVLAGIFIGLGIIINGRLNQHTRALRSPDAEYATPGMPPSHTGNPAAPPSSTPASHTGASRSGDIRLREAHAVLDVLTPMVKTAGQMTAEQRSILKKNLGELAANHAGTPAGTRALALMVELEKISRAPQADSGNPPPSSKPASQQADSEFLDGIYSEYTARADILVQQRRYGDAMRLLQNLPSPLNGIDTYRASADEKVATINDQAHDDFNSTMEKVHRLTLEADTQIENNPQIKQYLRTIISNFGIPEYVKPAQDYLKELQNAETLYIKNLAVKERQAEARKQTLRFAALLLQTNAMASQYHYDAAIATLKNFSDDTTVPAVRAQIDNAIYLQKYEKLFFARINSRLNNTANGIASIKGYDSAQTKHYVGITENGLKFIVQQRDPNTGELDTKVSGLDRWSSFSKMTQYKLFAQLARNRSDDITALAVYAFHHGIPEKYQENILQAKYRPGPGNKNDAIRIEKIVDGLTKILRMADTK